MTAKLTIEEFARSSFIDLKDKITCGFELETQSSDGRTYDEDREIDYDAANEDMYNAAIEYINNNESESIQEGIDSNHFLNKLNTSQVQTVLDSLGWSVSELCDNTNVCWDSIVERTIEYLQEDWDYSDYRMDAGDDFYIKGIEVVSDSSVNGYEFRTYGPRSYNNFLTSANEVFKIDHEIDDECSFHIHLQVKGIKHYSGKNIIKTMTEYILNNQDRLPKSVLDRFKQYGTYYRPSVNGTKKYSFIHCHSQGTWEFRCFGNVKNVSDAKKCLDLAIEAMQYAYQCKIGLKHKSDTHLLDDETWLEYARAAMTFGEPMTTVERFFNTTIAA